MNSVYVENESAEREILARMGKDMPTAVRVFMAGNNRRMIEKKGGVKFGRLQWGNIVFTFPESLNE